jgi:hypothetical protein
VEQFLPGSFHPPPLGDCVIGPVGVYCKSHLSCVVFYSFCLMWQVLRACVTASKSGKLPMVGHSVHFLPFWSPRVGRSACLDAILAASVGRSKSVTKFEAVTLEIQT